MESTSISLLDRIARSGDDAAWSKLTDVYRPFIQGVIRTYPGLASQADDITQEVMLVLMRELPAFERQRTGSFRTWLRGITVNQLRSALRKTKKHKATDISIVAGQIEELADPASVAAKKWDDAHDQFVLECVMATVKNEFREKTWQAFMMYAMEQQPAAKVADQLGLSVNSVLLAKSRILRRLREEAAGLVDD